MQKTNPNSGKETVDTANFCIVNGKWQFEGFPISIVEIYRIIFITDEANY